MNKGKNKTESVGLRPKPYTKPSRKAGKLANHPAIKELARMIEAGEVDRTRTIAYLKKDGRHE